MSAIRRLYFYGLALVSMEVVIWGVINLLRTILSNRLVRSGSLLATGLSLVLVGLPIFFLHWRTIQRDSQRETEERASWIRAVFLYAVLFTTLSPVVYAVLAIINRGLVALLGQEPFTAWFGGDGSAVDNLIAILVNGVAFFYFWSVLSKDWQEDIPEDYLQDTRRLYRYVWMVAGLVLFTAGIFNLLRYLLSLPGGAGSPLELAGGVALLLVGAPLWGYFWQLIQSSLGDVEEQRSLLRLVVFYLISLVGVVGVLTTAGGILNSLIRIILGEPGNFVGFFQGNRSEIAAVIPLAIVWSYYGRMLNREVAALPDQPRRAALRRLYYYILALLGLAVTFAGLGRLASFLAELLFTSVQIFSWRGLISGALSALLVGLPLWLMTWPEMQKEAARLDDNGDHARRSVLRKSYLYLVLFLLVIGAMAFAGQILYSLLNALFGTPPDRIARDVSELVLWLIIDVIFLYYHWQVLRQDGRLAEQSLGNLHAAFPTLILAEEGESRQFAEATVHALQRVAPRLPVAINQVERGAPDETLLAAKAVLLPVNLALDPPESLRMWLAEYKGKRILVPQLREGWLWLGQTVKSGEERAREAAQTLRQLAEGESVRASLPNNPWAMVGFILGGLFGLQLLAVLFSILISSLFR